MLMHLNASYDCTIPNAHVFFTLSVTFALQHLFHCHLPRLRFVLYRSL